MAKKIAGPKEVKLEGVLMNCRNLLRGKSQMTDKRDLLLTLVFFKFVTVHFEKLLNELQQGYAGESELPYEASFQ